MWRQFDEEKVDAAEDRRCGRQKMQKIDMHNIEVQKVKKMQKIEVQKVDIGRLEFPISDRVRD